MIEIEIISALLGSLIGLTLSLTGAGGALLAIPLLTFFLNLSPYQAAPIALFAVLTGSIFGAAQGLRKGIVRYKAALLVAITGSTLAPIGVILARHTTDQILSTALALMLVFIGFNAWRSGKQKSATNSHAAPPVCLINPISAKLFWTAPCTKRLVATGAASGLLSGLLGVGGGFVIVPSLNKVSNFNHQTIIATTLAAVSLITLSSITTHLKTSETNWLIAIPFTAGVMLSMLIASKVIGNKVSNHLSQKGFALLSFIAATYLLIKNFS